MCVLSPSCDGSFFKYSKQSFGKIHGRFNETMKSWNCCNKGAIIRDLCAYSVLAYLNIERMFLSRDNSFSKFVHTDPFDCLQPRSYIKCLVGKKMKRGKRLTTIFLPRPSKSKKPIFLSPWDTSYLCNSTCAIFDSVSIVVFSWWNTRLSSKPVSYFIQ